MAELSPEELTAIATEYEARLVPAVFQAWSVPVLTAAEVTAGDRVLDVACGTGVLARAAAEAVGREGAVTGIDLNPGMLAVAAGAAPDIDWRQGDVVDMPFGAESFDTVVSQFGLMMFPDKTAALREMSRVLRRGGRLAVAVFEGLEKNTAYGTMASVFARHAGEDVGNALRFPFSLGDEDHLLSCFTDAGLEEVELRRDTQTARFPNIRDMVLADVKGWFPLAGLALDGATIDAVAEDAAKELAPFILEDGSVRFSTHVHIVTAVKG